MRDSFKVKILLIFLFIYFASTIFIFVIFNTTYINSIKNKYKDENKFALKVMKNLIEEEKEKLKMDAKNIVEDDEVFFAVLFNFDLDIKRENNSIKPIIINLNKILKINLSDRLRRKIAYGNENKEFEIFNSKLEISLRSKGINKYNSHTGNEDFIQYRKKDHMNLKPLSIIEKRVNGFYITAVEKGSYNDDLWYGIVSKKINKEFIRNIQNKTNREILLFGNNVLVEKTINIDNKYKRNKDDNFFINSDKTKYYFDTLKLTDFNNNDIGEICIGYNYSQVEKVYKNSILKFLIIMLSFSFIIFILILLLLRKMFIPFDKIISEVIKLSEGEYDKIESNAKGELKLLENSINILSSEVKKKRRRFTNK